MEKEKTLGTRIKILKFIFVWDLNPLIIKINKLSSAVFLNAFLMWLYDPMRYHMINFLNDYLMQKYTHDGRALICIRKTYLIVRKTQFKYSQ